MVYCCAFNCTNRLSSQKRLKEGITFHSFPKDEDRRKRWLANIRREFFTVTAYTRICSQHFEQKMFDRTGQTTRLRQDAVPTLFDFPSNLKKASTQRAPPKDRAAASATCTSSDSLPADACNLGTTGSLATSPPAHSNSDHAYSIPQNVSPRKIKRKIDSLLDMNEQLKKKLRIEKIKCSRLKKTVKNLEGVIRALKDKNYVSSQCADLLQSTFSGIPGEIMKRMTSKKKTAEYTPELRSFAMTLSFYSAKAYRYVRKTFDLNLPHPAVLRKWYSSVCGEPGFTAEVLTALKAKVLKTRAQNEEVVCGLVLDEMAIRKHIAWDGKKFRGFVDLGTNVDNDSLPAASNALVMMVVGINGAWKVPCGYFFIDSLSGEEKSNLVMTSLEKLADVGLMIKSITCDGPSAHFQMIKLLGASVDAENIVPSFPHPCDPSKRVCVFLDACHMLKLVRNTLSDQRQIHTPEGVVDWRYVEALHSLQESEGLRLGTKLKSAHMNWQKQKMKVNLAAQTLSASIADALIFCRENLHLPEFVGCEATVTFIQTFNHLFDILNSRNPVAKGYKAPLRAQNFPLTDTFLQEAENYIRCLKDSKGTSILQSKRKTGFLGFCICINSVRMMVEDLLLPPSPALKYLLTYRMSQDHVELFFGAIRSAGGFNNNPTCTQFISTYKKLLMRNAVESGQGNCTPQEQTTILNVVEDCTRFISIQRQNDNVEDEADNDVDFLAETLPDVDSLSEFKSAAISYIAGYVVKMVRRKVQCAPCESALIFSPAVSHNIQSSGTGLSLVQFKNRGGLIIPSNCVVSICIETEKFIQREIKVNANALPKFNSLVGTIVKNVLIFTTQKNLFPSLHCHMFDSTPTTNHIFGLARCCTEAYLKIRMHHLGKLYTEKITGQKVRKQLSKLILFKHQ